ncbi:MAG TPA: hypothetical protein VL202_23840 [Pararhizobium sp.]|uniref:hypothetical protein n=1 Tax=Pararhizobium sp. TaxID=1977563 RepID=UPI002B58E9FA|nr:hypothetical protein [Pararhizobium sp.]HTO34177.1 hypothetical protein [Pararhizobium sp.]
MTDWNADKRRILWRRSVATMEAQGLPVEKDPRFLGWVEDWIAGHIPMAEVQRRYGQLLSETPAEPADAVDATTYAVLDEVRQEIPNIAGVSLSTAEERAERTQKITDAWQSGRT